MPMQRRGVAGCDARAGVLMPLRGRGSHHPAMSTRPHVIGRTSARTTESGPARESTWSWVSARGLSIACFALYVIAQLGAVIAGWFEFADEQSQHGQTVTVFGDDGFAWTALEQTLQNWQSEF